MHTPQGASLSDERPATTATRQTRLWVSLGAAVLVVDQLTKWWAERALEPGVARPLVGEFLQLYLVYNPGAAFSMGTGYTVILTCVALGVVAVGITMSRRITSRAWAATLGLLLGGALGNVCDRLFREPGPFRGHVVDFLQLPHWPIFNVADIAVSCGAACMIVLSLRGVRLDGTRDGRSEA